MINLEDLEQLVAFSKYGTLSKAATELNISQPTITRTMKRIEDEFGVSLFVRGKNSICLNETGTKAVELSINLLNDAANTIKEVYAYDQSLKTISVCSCAPAPLWTLLPVLSEEYPTNFISSSLCKISDIIENVKENKCDIGIIPHIVECEDISCVPFMKENLSVCIPCDHELSNQKHVTFDMINGFNFLLRSEIGFWNEICREKMPASRFLIQTDDFEFNELIKNSSLPFFTTNAVHLTDELRGNRVVIPVTDTEANVTYYLLSAQKCYLEIVWKLKRSF